MPDAWIYKIGNTEIKVDLTKLSQEERTVMSLITFDAKKGKNGRITQRQIVESARWIGCHPDHEKEIGLRNPQETTQRQVRAIIRRLRIDHHVPILSDVKGYWIPDNMDEVDAAIVRLEATARSQARSWHETYQELKSSFAFVPAPSTASFFEDLRERVN